VKHALKNLLTQNTVCKLAAARLTRKSRRGTKGGNCLGGEQLVREPRHAGCILGRFGPGGANQGGKSARVQAAGKITRPGTKVRPGVHLHSFVLRPFYRFH